jgi:Ca-activated chloride channel homolog
MTPLASFSLELARPAALLALIALPAILYIHSRSLVDLPRTQKRLALAVRLLALTLLTLALAGLTLLTTTDKQFVVFLLDQSASIDQEAASQAKTYINQALPHAKNNQTTLLPFAATPGTPQNPAKIADENSDTQQVRQHLPTFDANSSNIALALQSAAASAPPNLVPHLVLLSDGNQTTGNALQTAASLGIRISTIPLFSAKKPEVQVRSVQAPIDVRRGEPFYLDVTIDSSSPQSTTGTLQVFRGPHKVADNPLTLNPGENKFRLKQAISDEKTALFTVRVLGFPDTLAQNNQAQAIVTTGGKPRVLIVESDPKSARMLDDALKEQDIQVEVRPTQGLPSTLADLSNFDVLILSNVPATSLRPDQMQLVKTYVQDLGGGLIMIGGDQSFGLGGYQKTPIEQALPVRSDFEQQSEKPGLAMVMVIDRSGSMGGQKLEMAKEAAKAAVDLLGPKDLVGIVAFDSQPHWVCDLRSAADKTYINSRIASIKPAGGTNIAPGMELAKNALQNANARLKHVIVLTDGISAPGDFDGLSTRMADLKITISSVAVGQDADANLLSRIAKIGGGRFYQVNNPANIPQVFARETITAGKGAITEDPFLPQIVRPTPVLAGVGLDSAPFLLGYVRTRAKPTSQVILLTEQGDPLLVWWRYGLGMSVAFTSDAKPKWAAEWASWPGYSRFWAQIIRHAMRRTGSQNLSLQLTEENGKTHVALDAVTDANTFISPAPGSAPVVLHVIRPDLSALDLTLTPTAPGRYQASFDSSAPGAYHLQATLPQGTSQQPLQQSRAFVVGYPDELRISPPNLKLLSSLAQSTQGMDNPAPEQLFTPPPTTAQDAKPLWPWLTAAAILLFILDVALRRIDFTLYFPRQFSDPRQNT